MNYIFLELILCWFGFKFKEREWFSFKFKKSRSKVKDVKGENKDIRTI